MVRRNLGLPHRLISKNFNCVIWVKNTIFGGEGLFFAQLQGPGKVWIQTLPISRLASRILQYAGPSGRREEGSVLGKLGNMLDGDGF